MNAVENKITGIAILTNGSSIDYAAFVRAKNAPGADALP